MSFWYRLVNIDNFVVNTILAMPWFWEHLEPQPNPKCFAICDEKLWLWFEGGLIVAGEKFEQIHWKLLHGKFWKLITIKDFVITVAKQMTGSTGGHQMMELRENSQQKGFFSDWLKNIWRWIKIPYIDHRSPLENTKTKFSQKAPTRWFKNQPFWKYDTKTMTKKTELEVGLF